MKLTCEDRDQLKIMAVQGEFLAEDVQQFSQATSQRMQSQDTRDFVIDCSKLEFVDSKGLEAMLELQDTCVDRLGQVHLAACQDNLHAILEITRLAARFTCHADVESAVRSLR